MSEYDLESPTEPSKISPGYQAQSSSHNVADQYQSMAKSNPYLGTPFYRDFPQNRESIIPLLSVTNTEGPVAQNHAATRRPHAPVPNEKRGMAPSSLGANPNQENHAVSTPGNQATESIYSPAALNVQKEVTGSVPARNHARTSSMDFFRGIPISGLANSRRNVPAPIHTGMNPTHFVEEEDMDIKDEDWAEKLLTDEEAIAIAKRASQSPLKKLFGERGILSRSTGDMTAKKKTEGLATRLLHRMETIMEKITNFDLNGRLVATVNQREPFEITLDPLTQGLFYVKLELLLTQEINEYLLKELRASRLSEESVVRVCEAWNYLGRAQVTCFRFDLQTQRKLVVQNIATVQLGGVGPFDGVKLQSILKGWKVLAKELSVRTFCNGDNVIRKHLALAEKVLSLVGADRDAKKAFEGLRIDVMRRIYAGELAKHEKRSTAVLDETERRCSPRDI